MNKRLRDAGGRYTIITTIIVALLIALAVRLFFITMIQHDYWINEASQQMTKTIYTSAPRGNIYDRNGNLLAGNRQVFNVAFNASSLTTEEINETSLTMINKLIENGDDYNDDFPIIIDEHGRFTYSFDTDLANWLDSHGFTPGTPAADVFDAMCMEYSIPSDMDRYDAMSELYNKHKIDLPINVRTMKYTYRANKESFWTRFGITTNEDGELDARECFKRLRENYRIDENLSDKEARKIFVVRNKIAANSFQKYLPLTIATDISDYSVVFFEESNLPGVEVSSETVRYYPYGDLACHIIGYMGAISDSDIETYVEKRGYMISDLIGKSGIEGALEEKLHGEPGITTVMVNSSGSYVNTVSEETGTKGQDVYLTIYAELQKATENALANVVRKNPTSRTGAAVVLDVRTGDVLAMASYPSFDLNMFADGISNEEWASVQPENPRDYLSPTPLFNNCTRLAVAPGSTFKPITALAALEKGLNPNQYIIDQGFIEIGDREFGCAAWNESKITDGSQNLELGMGNSCNYYFACIATGKDWGTGQSLGYSISIDDIIEKAAAFGLFENTGIEIGDVSRNPVSADTKLRNYRYAVYQALQERARIYFPEEVYNNQEKLDENITKIADWIYDPGEYWDVVIKMQEETDVLEDQVENCASMVYFDYFIQSTWTTFDVFNVSIGQGDNNYTPLHIANYVATLGNHGIRNQVNLVYGVEKEGRTDKSNVVDTHISEANRAEILKGMRRVCTGGTLRETFSNFPIPVVGKTGTAEYQSIKQPEDEVAYVQSILDTLNRRAGTEITWDEVEKKIDELLKLDANLFPSANDAVDEAVIQLSDRRISQTMIDAYKDGYEDFAWTVAMAPYEDPEIAIAVLLPEGGHGAEASEAAADIILAYYNLDEEGVSIDTSETFVNTEDNGSNVFH